MKNNIKRKLWVMHLLILMGSFSSCASVPAQPRNTPMAKILVLYHSQNHGTQILAEAIARGISATPGAEAILKHIPNNNNNPKEVSSTHPQLTSAAELAQYDGLALGSPVYFGAMSGAMKTFLDQTLSLWQERQLAGIPATVFMSAGSGSGNEAAILGLWTVLASHGMIIVPTGTLGMAQLDLTIPQGHTPFGITALTGTRADKLPSEEELKTAQLQGQALAQTAIALKAIRVGPLPKLPVTNIQWPEVPAPVGNYKPYVISGNHVYINQIALEHGKVLHPGIVGKNVSMEEAKQAAAQTMLNVLAVLRAALKGDLSRVRQVVQLTGYFNTAADFKDHSMLMNSASDLAVKILGNKRGEHARAAFGASSLPLNSPVEIQAIFEI